MKSPPKNSYSPTSSKKIKDINSSRTNTKQVRQDLMPQSVDGQTVAWQFHRRDRKHNNWGWDRQGDSHLESILQRHLQNLETMTWGELLKASGGRSHGNNHHSIPIQKLAPTAIARLQELRLDDIDELFSLRLTGKIRVWGIKDGRVLKLLWYDEDHTVYPV